MPVDLSKDPLLGSAFKAAQHSIDRYHLNGQRYCVYLVIDHSLSMGGYFRNGHVQHLAERTLALAAHFDDDGTVPVFFFDNDVRDPVDVSVTNFAGAIDRMKARSGRMTGTDYAKAMRAVRNYHRKHKPGQLGFVIFQTDGAPNSRSNTENELCDAAMDPLFWQFVGFGDEGTVPPGEGARFDFLRKLDTLSVPQRRPVDNAGFFPAGADPKNVPDHVLYDNLMAELPTWHREFVAHVNAGRMHHTH